MVRALPPTLRQDTSLRLAAAVAVVAATAVVAAAGSLRQFCRAELFAAACRTVGLETAKETKIKAALHNRTSVLRTGKEKK